MEQRSSAPDQQIYNGKRLDGTRKRALIVGQVRERNTGEKEGLEPEVLKQQAMAGLLGAMARNQVALDSGLDCVGQDCGSKRI